jgi:hypothetical protein
MLFSVVPKLTCTSLIVFALSGCQDISSVHVSEAVETTVEETVDTSELEKAELAGSPTSSATVYGLKQTYNTSTVRSTSLSKSVWRDTFTQRVVLKKGDLLIVNASQQYSEKQLKTNRVIAQLFVGGKAISSTGWQYLARSNNHHMPLGLTGQYRSPKNQTVVVRMRAKKSYNSTVILDSPRYGSMAIEHYRRFSSH